jgi:hypothetical protein
MLAPAELPSRESQLALALALNSLNRPMGQSDLHPFVFPAPAIAKPGFVHGLIHDAR